MLALADEPRLLSAVPGRVRVHLPGWQPAARIAVEKRIRKMPGVRCATANELTRNILIQFDPEAIATSDLLDHLSRIEAHRIEPIHDTVHAARPTVVNDSVGGKRRMRITVRGLDRDPELGREIVERLEKKHGVHAIANPLTGRVLIEFGHKITELEEILGEIEHIELPDMAGEDRPRHPLDPAPLLQSATRVLGAVLGLGFVVTRRILNLHGSVESVRGAARAAGVLGLIQSFPFIRTGMRRVFGRSLADMLFYAPIMAGLALSESVLGLTVTGIEAVRLLTEILARRSQFRRYEERLGDRQPTHPGNVVRVDAGQRAPHTATIIEGNGVAVSRDGSPRPVQPGDRVRAGARMYGGPFLMELQGHDAFEPTPRPEEPTPRLYDKYVAGTGLASLLFAGAIAIRKRSLGGLLESLLLVNTRAAVIASDLGDVSAFSRAIRAGVTVIGTRIRRNIHKPDLLLLDNPRILVSGLDVSRVHPLTDLFDGNEILSHAASIAAAAGGPWGGALSTMTTRPAEEGGFEGRYAVGVIEGRRWRIGPCPETSLPRSILSRHEGESRLLVEEQLVGGQWSGVGVIFMRPRIAAGVDELVATCRQHGIEIAMLHDVPSRAAEVVSRKSGVALIGSNDGPAVIYARQEQGQRVFFVSDHAHSGEAFANCDLAIGISTGRSGSFQARADLLSPDIGGLTAIVQASVKRETAVNSGVLASFVGNVVGAIWGLTADVEPEVASQPVYVAAIAASLLSAWFMRGGERHRSVMAELSDPRPEKWGARTIESVLKTFQTSVHGLTHEHALQRVPRHIDRPRVDEIWKTVLDQFRSPMPALLIGAGGLALFLGAYLDFAVIASTLAVNVVVGAWQERQAGRAAEALKRVAAPAARVLRNGKVVQIKLEEVVTGDVLVLAPGDRVSADARVISAHALEVDEASLTGESNPVPKGAAAHPQGARVVLEGSDVVSGHGRAVVFAIGHNTRLGATAAALSMDETQHTPLGQRLGRLLRQVLPMAVAGGGAVFASGLLRGQAFLPQLAVAASIALAAVPEGLPLLAGLGQMAVSRRLARKNALVRRLSAVEALGRVDVACSDKTGTLTIGKLTTTLVADLVHEQEFDDELPEGLSQVLLTAAWASPHPEAADASAHPTDVAVLSAADRAGLGREIRRGRGKSVPFDPARSFHAAVVGGRLRLKGAPEVITRMCTSVRVEGIDKQVDDALRERLLTRADTLARRGLRVLMVAEGDETLEPDQPQNLVAIGYIGIQDPLRDDAAEAIANCHKAGIRVVMLTGDHPSTARAIAADAGLAIEEKNVLTGAEIEQVSDDDLDVRLRSVTVIARATPLDKLRIIEGLQRSGHCVAMTGDGVNDAPALRLADVGVAMGKGGTEVARQAADLILNDDSFSTLVLALIEGRSFWRNMRRSLGLLLGGNLGELGMVCGATLLGFASPLTTRQILAVNLITDALPAMSVVLQQPEHRDLSALSREGVNAVDVSLRTDAFRRSIATAVPALANYFLILRGGGSVTHARTVAFSSIVVTQLAQTLDAGWTQGGITHPVLKAIGASAALLGVAMVAPPLQEVFTLAMPGSGWLMTGLAGGAAVVISRLLAALGFTATAAQQRRLLPAPVAASPARALPAPGAVTLHPGPA